MKRFIVICSLVLGAAANGSEYILKYRWAFSSLDFQSRNFHVLSQHIPGKFIVVEIPDATKQAALAELLTQPNAEYLVPDVRVHLFQHSRPTGVTLRPQWAIQKMQAEKAWQRAGNKGSRKIVVAVIDTGADYTHVSLRPNMVKGYNFIENNDDPMDITYYGFPGHGTHCSGLIGATGLIDGGTTGLSPVVSIMPLRFINDEGGLVSDGIRAIDYAIAHGANVISASWGGAMSREDAKPLIEAVARAEKAGVVFVTAAGNDGKNNDGFETYPANAGLANTITVAATEQADAKPEWSNFGRAKVHTAAPGNWILSTLPGNNYADMDGTSMSAPLIAGLVALVKAQDPNLTPIQIRSLIEATGDRIAIENACDCRANAFKAIDQVVGQKMYVSPYGVSLSIHEQVTFDGVYGKPPLTFSTSNEAVASIDSNGILTGLAKGSVQVKVRDANGQEATSYHIYIR